MNEWVSWEVPFPLENKAAAEEEAETEVKERESSQHILRLAMALKLFRTHIAFVRLSVCPQTTVRIYTRQS